MSDLPSQPTTTLDLTKAHPLHPLATAWESYRTRVVPADAPPIQVQECRRAFYAGAQAFLSAAADSKGPHAEDRAINVMCNELHQFITDVQNGRA
jgi:hypothetical protein